MRAIAAISSCAADNAMFALIILPTASIPSEIDSNVPSWPPSMPRSRSRYIVPASASSTVPSIAIARHGFSTTATDDMM